MQFSNLKKASVTTLLSKAYPSEITLHNKVVGSVSSAIAASEKSGKAAEPKRREFLTGLCTAWGGSANKTCTENIKQHKMMAAQLRSTRSSHHAPCVPAMVHAHRTISFASRRFEQIPKQTRVNLVLPLPVRLHQQQMRNASRQRIMQPKT